MFLFLRPSVCVLVVFLTPRGDPYPTLVATSFWGAGEEGPEFGDSIFGRTEDWSPSACRARGRWTRSRRTPVGLRSQWGWKTFRWHPTGTGSGTDTRKSKILFLGRKDITKKGQIFNESVVKKKKKSLLFFLNLFNLMNKRFDSISKLY